MSEEKNKIEHGLRMAVQRWLQRTKRPIVFFRLVRRVPRTTCGQWNVKDFSLVVSLVDAIVDRIRQLEVNAGPGNSLVLEGFEGVSPSWGTSPDVSFPFRRSDFADASEVVTPEVARAAEAAVGVVDAPAPVKSVVVHHDQDLFDNLAAWMSKTNAPPLAELQLHTAAAQPGTLAPFPAIVTMTPGPEWSSPSSTARQIIDQAVAFFLDQQFSAGQKCTFIVRGLFRYPVEASMMLQSSFVRESRFSVETPVRQAEEATPKHPFDALGEEFNHLDELAFLKLALERAGGHPAESWKAAKIPRLRWELMNWVTKPRPLSENEIAAGRVVAGRLNLRAELLTILRRWSAQRLVKRIQLTCDVSTPDGSTVLRALRYWSGMQDANEDTLVKLAQDIVSEVERDRVVTEHPLQHYSLLGLRENEDIYHTRWRFPREPGRRDALIVPLDPKLVTWDLESKAVGPNVAAALGSNVSTAFGVKEPAQEEAKPVPMLLWCPACGERHIDAGEFAVKPHHTHACQECGMVWRPALVPTCGVAFLPGFKNL